MPRIFISYRRTDSSAVTGRIYDRLVNALGERSVFKDVDDIPPGADFRKVLENEVGRADVLLVIIGRQWASVTDEQGQKRLYDPNDFVRIEIETSLNRENILTVPVLVDNATMPDADQLPNSLQDLRYRNAVPVRNDPDFNRDIARLINHLKNISESRKVRRVGPSRRIMNLIGVFIVTLLLAAMAAVLILWQRGAEEALVQSATNQAGTVIAQNMTSAVLSNRVGTLEVMTVTFAAILPTQPPTMTDTPQPSTLTARFTDDNMPTGLPSSIETDTSHPPTATNSTTPIQRGQISAPFGLSSNVRQAPDIETPIVATVATGTLVEIIEPMQDETGNWRHIRLEDGTTGWIAADVVIPVDVSTVTGIANFDLIVRTAPTVNSISLTTIPVNTRIVLLATNQEQLWYKVRYENQEGWIRADGLTLEGDISRLPIEDE
jgi:SH3-like domain-containing protein